MSEGRKPDASWIYSVLQHWSYLETLENKVSILWNPELPRMYSKINFQKYKSMCIWEKQVYCFHFKSAE